MPDDRTKRRPQDATTISLTQPHEVNWWCDWLKCTKDELREAVAAVGHEVEAVRLHFKRRRGY